VGCTEGLVHTHVYTDRFHGIDGFNMVEFDGTHQDDPENPIVEDEHSSQAIAKLVKKYQGN
jgi:hypothetical protein